MINHNDRMNTQTDSESSPCLLFIHGKMKRPHTAAKLYTAKLDGAQVEPKR